MKKLILRSVSSLLIGVMLLALLPVVSPVKAHAVTKNQQNIVDRADYFYDTTWVCQKTIMAWRDESKFEAGQTYRLPYAQPVNSGQFIGYGVTLEDFLAAAADVNSVYYSRQSEFNGWTSAYYGTDCAAFVAMCWGTVRQDCSTLPYFSTNIGVVSTANLSKIQLGDALDSTSVGHVVLVTDLSYDESGNLTQIEITEQTPPQLKRSYFTPAELVEKYGKEFYIYRYYGTVPEAPVRGYITECQALAAYCDIQITEDAPIMSLPCYGETEETSVQLRAATADEKLVATKLYKNTAGELWYRVALSNKEEGYIPAEYTVYQGQILTDIALTAATAPAVHVRGQTFAVNGSISALHNSLTTASVYVYNGFGGSGVPVTGGEDVVSSNDYTLKNSSIDYQTSFGTIGLGRYTYAIAAQYQNYYATGKDTYEKNTGKVTLMEEYFQVLSYSVNQNTCSHRFTTEQLSQSTCTQDGLTVKWCGTCGLVSKQILSAKGHSYGDWTVGKPADCTEDGSQSRVCYECKDAQQEVIPAKGHDYQAVSYDTDCQTLAHTTHTCSRCGDYYNTFADEVMSDWQTELPDVDVSLMESKQQYRYRDLETMTSNEATVEGWMAVDHTWTAREQGTVTYVQEWPAGFDTANSLYAAYNNVGSKVSASETEDTKIVVDSDAVVGYLYYHWCSASDWNHYSYANKTNTHTIFHAYYSENNPDSYLCDTSDMSYKTSDVCCANGNSQWFFVVKVYRQSYMKHSKQYIHERWSEWSDWSDTALSETQTRQAENRTAYRYVNAQYGDHDYVDGICSVCGDVVEQKLPTIIPSYATVSFEGQIQLNIYYQVTDLGDVGVEDMGLLVWDTSNPEGTVDDAVEIIAGAVTDGTQFMVHTNGIAAKKLGDMVYFKIYARLADGNYVYTDMFSTSPQKYAMGILSKTDSDPYIQALCVAMLNYGAAAQEYFGYKTDNLINGELIQDQLELVEAYSAEMMDPVVKATAEKSGAFIRNTEAFTQMYPTVSFEGAFAINYYFVNSLTPDDGMSLYFWNAETYENSTVLTVDNATAAMEMVCDGNRFWGEVANIAAKEMDSTVYVAGVYSSDGVTYTTGVIAYSLGGYCKGIAENPVSDAQELAAHTAVYGYYAELYFDHLA